MMRLHHAVVLALVLFGAPVLRAQDSAGSRLPVRTFQLRHLDPSQAASLVSPYVQGYGTGVFKAGSGLDAITVRAPVAVLAVVDSLLKVNDRAPATIRLRFRLIAASDSADHDASVAGVAAALRGLFRFRGYRLLGEGVTSVGEGSGFRLTIGTPSEPSGYDNVLIMGHVGEISAAGASRSVDLGVSMEGGFVRDASGSAERGAQLSTDLTIPLGQTIVLGSAAGEGRARTLILAVRADAVSEGH